MKRNDSTRILISEQGAQRLAKSITRRTFLAWTGASAAALAIAGCGSDSKTGAGPSSSDAEVTEAGTATDLKRTVNMFTWAEYDDLELLKRWGDVKLTIFNSNDEAIQKLVQGGDSSGYDIVVPTGSFIPQMVKAGLLKRLDKSRIPNFANLDPVYANQSWDPDNQYSVCKDWGSVGWIYDTTVVTTELKTWNDFIAAAQGPASGNTSLLDVSTDVAGMYFWANDIDWTTESTADLDACEKFLVDNIASHVKAFDSYPGIKLSSGSYALSMVFNGDARQGLLGIKAAGGDPSRYRWGLGAPATELWMDNWCILEQAKNVDAAYDFINFILDPENSISDLRFHGYNTGIKGVEALAGDLEYKELIFFTPDEVSRLRPGAVNSAQDRLIEILSKVKAKAGK